MLRAVDTERGEKHQLRNPQRGRERRGSGGEGGGGGGAGEEGGGEGGSESAEAGELKKSRNIFTCASYTNQIASSLRFPLPSLPGIAPCNS